MRHTDAVALIRLAVPEPGGVWVDAGAGAGTFTLALAELLGAEGRVFAVDRDRSALARLRAAAAARVAQAGLAAVEARIADFTAPLADLPDALDGVLLANALHFVLHPAPVLRRFARRLRPGGCLLVVEYEGRRASPWVPFPIPFDVLVPIVAAAGFGAPERIATRPSAYGGVLYAAVAVRLYPEALPPGRGI